MLRAECGAGGGSKGMMSRSQVEGRARVETPRMELQEEAARAGRPDTWTEPWGA